MGHPHRRRGVTGRAPKPQGAFPTFEAGFDDGFGREAHGRQVGRFYRQNGHLLLIPLGRGVSRGQGGDIVSSNFVYEMVDNDAAFTAEEAQAQVSAAWATDSASAVGVLKAAINQALHDAGFRAPDGSDLT